jgi:HAAS domain-containing protein
VNSTAQDEITTYVSAVRAALAGLPDATRDELIEDLPEHLAEVQAEGAGTLVERLGTPEAYAAELRATAGFVGGFPDPPVKADPLAELRDNALRLLRIADVRVGPLLGYARSSEFLTLLRPAWWVLRGYLAAMVVAWLLDDSGQPMGLLPRIGGSEVVALLLLAGGIVGSVWLGRHTFGPSPWAKYALWSGTAVLVLVAIAGFFSADSSARDQNYTDVNYSNNNNPYSNVQDVFVYDDQNRLVPGARLYDQDGQPIQLGNPYCNDDETGESNHSKSMGYPYCPENAPFRTPSSAPTPSPSVTPSGSVSPSRPVPSTVTPSPSR